ncbi:MAG: class I SAM-dependent methyltransferase [Minisyncoccia bacterium]
MKSLKKILKKNILLVEHYFCVLLNGKDNSYGEIGLFVKNNPTTTKYTYANWGSRLWELKAVETWLDKVNIKDKNVVDIGIGLPSDSNFYKFYVNSGCNLKAYDLDARLTEVIKLSDKCTIYNKSSDSMIENSDNSVDVVVALSSLEHYPLESFNKTISEVYRILKPNGLFLVTLDLTLDKKSADWAILEKTINNLPAEENNLDIGDKGTQLTLEKFIGMLSPLFYTKSSTIKNIECRNSGNLLSSKKWNSYISYVHLYKK